VNGPPPSIRARLGGALLLWSLLGSVAIAVAVTLAARREVDELLDETLGSTAAALAVLLSSTTEVPAGARARQAPAGAAAASAGTTDGPGFAWQLVTDDGRLLLRSAAAPDTPWRPTPQVGFAVTGGWRVLGVALGAPEPAAAGGAASPLPAGRTLYVAHALAERGEARAEVTLAAMLGTFAVALLGLLVLRAAVRSELEPLQSWSERLAASDPERAAALAPPTRAELVPMHRALAALTLRLQDRVARERAWSAHAAHALRTPLAGIDAQLAVASREAPPDLRQRLERARAAAARLRSVVDALIGLFRSDGDLRRARHDLAALVQRLPVAGLEVEVEPGTGGRSPAIDADADLLSAALANLLDNAARHGARHARLGCPGPQRLRIDDDGPGVDDARRAAIQQALDEQALDGQHDEARTGLGLMLADRVARAHGGRVVLPAVAGGFAVELRLAPADGGGGGGGTGDGSAA
jgi:signal transduction histidine kinase